MLSVSDSVLVLHVIGVGTYLYVSVDLSVDSGLVDSGLVDLGYGWNLTHVKISTFIIV